MSIKPAMTEKEFFALEPRERDALVAEKVMGIPWERGEELHECGIISNGYIKKLNAWIPRGYAEQLTGDPIESYTTEIADAWLVVEEVREGGHGWQLTGYGATDPKAIPEGMWWATIYPEKKYNPHTHGIGPLPLAVSLAALKAKGEIE